MHCRCECTDRLEIGGLSDPSREGEAFISGANARLNPLYKVWKDGGHVHSDIFRNIKTMYKYIC